MPAAIAGVIPFRLLCCFSKFFQTVESATISQVVLELFREGVVAW